MSGLTLRRMRPGEELRLYEVLRSAVHRGTAGQYNDAERQAWAPVQPFEGWQQRLAATECFVAVVEGLIAGFMSVTSGGHVDLAYVLPDMHGSGIGSRLLERVETEMHLTGVTRATTEASLAAVPFFRRHGWVTEGEETVERAGEKLRRYMMSKTLSAHDSQSS